MNKFIIFAADACFKSKKVLFKVGEDTTLTAMRQLSELISQHIGLTSDPDFYGHPEYVDQACSWYKSTDIFGDSHMVCSMRACKPRQDLSERRRIYRYNVIMEQSNG